jgi:probable addiction module antidote protein
MRMRSKSMEKITFEKWNPVEDIETKEDVLAILEATIELAVEENDPQFLLRILGYIAQSEGMVQLASELNLDRADLYKALSHEGNPSFITVVKVLNNLGFQLNISQKKAS